MPRPRAGFSLNIPLPPSPHYGCSSCSSRLESKIRSNHDRFNLVANGTATEFALLPAVVLNVLRLAHHGPDATNRPRP